MKFKKEYRFSCLKKKEKFIENNIRTLYINVFIDVFGKGSDFFNVATTSVSKESPQKVIFNYQGR